MTLVYARRFDDLIYCIADTSAIISSLAEATHPFEEPFIKILPINADVTIAFAGNSYFLRTVPVSAFRQNDLPSILRDVAERAGNQIEFLLINKRNWKLVKIDGTGAHERDVVTLGSQEARELLQEQRANLSPGPPTQISVTKLPLRDPAPSSVSNKVYAKDLNVFFEVLDFNRDDCAGVAVPFTVTRAESSYGVYARNVRGPLDASELAPESWTTVALQDNVRGGFSISFAGDDHSFAYHVFEVGFGLVYRFSLDGPHTWRITRIPQKAFYTQVSKLLGRELPLTMFE